MSDPTIEELEKRIRWLEEQLEQARQAHNDFVKTHNRRFDEWQNWLNEHEGVHLDIDEFIRALSQRVFPGQEQFWKEADKILGAENSSPIKEGGVAPLKDVAPPIAPMVQSEPEEYTHDRWCLCAECQAKVAEEARLDAERVFAETGHEKWCRCKPCTIRRQKEGRRKDREAIIQRGDDPDDVELPPTVDRNALERNPFSDAPQPYITNHSLPSAPRKAPAHEPQCICLECVRWRGMGRRKK